MGGCKPCRFSLREFPGLSTRQRCRPHLTVRAQFQFRNSLGAIVANTPVLNFQDFIAADGEILTTDSLQVATVFGKPHYRVLRAIRSLQADLPIAEHAAFFGAMFITAEIGNGATRQDPAYRITRDGFALLAMGFTGKKALAFKVAYINAFNAMAAFIKNQRDGLTYRCLKNEMDCKDSVSRGSVHGRGLNQRRLEIAVLKTETALLLALTQPTLLN